SFVLSVLSYFVLLFVVVRFSMSALTLPLGGQLVYITTSLSLCQVLFLQKANFFCNIFALDPGRSPGGFQTQLAYNITLKRVCQAEKSTFEHFVRMHKNRD
ncbi:MAG: hypothetical protein IJK33_06800, partial [Clostridia bacterium]|nr:hypothetical protein [Clostridia bacterium]